MEIMKKDLVATIDEDEITASNAAALPVNFFKWRMVLFMQMRGI